jgi:hypothetical protein
MTTDYEKQLEEEIISLKNLLDERTKELDAAKESLKQMTDGLSLNRVAQFPFVEIKEMDVSSVSSHSTFQITAPVIGIGNTKLSENDVNNLHHLWCLHMQRENNPPLLYRIWRKITSCLTTKKN